jgi:hypothetical protein
MEKVGDIISLFHLVMNNMHFISFLTILVAKTLSGKNLLEADLPCVSGMVS